MPSELIEAVLHRNISSDHAKELVDMIKKGDLAAIVSNGLAGDMLAASPNVQQVAAGRRSAGRDSRRGGS
eukprot:2812576-Pleurochrysis_carterae.AAC.1